MSAIAVLFFVVSTAQTAPPQTDEGSSRLEVRVVDGVTGDPLRNAQMRLSPGSALGVMPAGDALPAGTIQGTTDAEGVWIAEGLAAGDWTLFATRVGYSSASLDGRTAPGSAGIPILISPGVDRNGILRMDPAAVAAGRVLSARGQPAAGLTVTPFRWIYDDFGEQTPFYYESRITDDRGEFRFNDLASGAYGFRLSRDGWAQLDDPAAVLPLPLYYPGLRNQGDASTVDLQRGAEFRLNDFVMPLLESGRLHIRVLDLAGVPVEGRHIIRIIPDGESASMRQGLVPGGSEVTTGAVPWGRYDVQVRGLPGNLDGRESVDVYAEETDVEIRVSATAELRGQVMAFPGSGGEPVPVEGVELQFVHPDPDEMGARFRRIVTNAGGAFSSPPIQVGARYRVRVLGVPAGKYLEPIVYNGADILQEGLRLEEPGEVTLDVRLSEPAAIISGTVADADGQAVPGAVVALLPDDRSRTHMFGAVRADAQGEFRMESVAPGSYKAYAWFEAPGAAWRNTEFMAEYDDLGEAVIATAGDAQDLTVIVLDPQ